MTTVPLRKPIHCIFDHIRHHPKRYGFIMLVFILIAGLWPFNFVTPNRAVINPEGGLVLERYGTVYEAARVEKLYGLTQFTIYLDLTTASNGLSAFEKIVSLADSQKDMNFIVGQWKDGVVLHIPDHARQKEIHFGKYGVFKTGERTQLTITYDGMALALHQDGQPIQFRKTGPLSFSGWSRDYPLVIGTEAHGKSQWKGTIYEIAMWDRAIAPGEVQGLRDYRQTADSRQQAGRSSKGLQNEGGSHAPENGSGPLIHYVFKPEFTYGTEYEGRKALGVKDLGKGEPADLVVPEQFLPYRRTHLTWQSDWMDKKTYWLDVAVNILGFIPFGALFFLQLARRKIANSRQQAADSRQQAGDSRQQTADSRQQTGDGRQPTADGRQQTADSRTESYGLVILTVAAGFAVSLLIEYLQAFLPSRDSSMTDLAMNTAGTLIGALVAATQLKKKESL